MKKTAFNDDWFFTQQWDDRLIDIQQDDTVHMEAVRLPHTNTVLPFNNFDTDRYQMVCGYVKFFFIPETLRGKRVFIVFDGAAHVADVFCNGTFLGQHRCGYTAFRFELTEILNYGGINLLSIKLDSREKDVPPFGGVIDYLTYGGLYREVRLGVSEKAFIEDLFIRGYADGSFRCSVSCNMEPSDELRIRIFDRDGNVCFPETTVTNGDLSGKTDGITPWSCEHPVLYTAEASLFRDGQMLDSEKVCFGFRTAEFRKEGFYLNGEKIRIRGLDRHQCWPYIGYAAPKRPQQLDADILKYELGCNAVRTSHYPQSQHFIDRCDEIGLLVFTELPGWQHIGDENWIRQAVENVREMVTQYRNHPSIILWGVRINESKDNDRFYTETNRTAHELDDSRCTGGVRNFPGSHLLEDVYTYNDFVHCGWNAGCEPKSAITSDPEKPYLVTEYCGHIFPTKPFDDESHRTAHALRHARVLNDIAAQPDIAGSFGWCMFDYNTHREFGSGDNVCWHGVMDMFRNPKFAAAAYASQSDGHPVLEIGTTMDIGDYPAFMLTETVAFSNADELALYKDGDFVKTFRPTDKFAALRHPPFIIDDFIGCLLETRDHFDAVTAADLKTVIKAFVRYAEGPYSEEMLAAKKRLNDRGIKDEQIHDLQNQYMTYWGDGICTWRLDAIKNSKVVISRSLTPARDIRLDVSVDCCDLSEEDSWDMSSIRITARDTNGNLQPYCSRALKLSASGAVDLIGPDCVPLMGGMAGCCVRSKGVAGPGQLTISCDGMPPVRIDFSVRIADKEELH